MKTKLKKPNLKQAFSKIKKPLLKISVVFLGAFALANLALFIFFLDRTYPQTFVSQYELGVVQDTDIEQKLDQLGLDQRELTLTYKDQAIKTAASDLGVAYESESVAENIRDDRSWLPILNLLRQHNLDFDVTIDDEVFFDKLSSLTEEYQEEPQNAQIVLNDGEFNISSESTGHELDIEEAKSQFVAQFKANNDSIQLPYQDIEPETKTKDLTQELEKLESRQDLTINLNFEGQTFTPSPKDIANWHTRSDSTYNLSDQKIFDYISTTSGELDANFSNTNAAVAAIKQALSDQENTTFTLVRAPVATTVNYCVSARGVSADRLAGLSSKAANVYQDSRGWASTGQYRFQEVSNGCSFVLWLAAADQMTSFSTACSSYWSCRVGVNVIINIDRWDNASPAWNQSGGNLDDYRSMVINHETGHWLGFGHLNCGGPGQLAPVMQQQSIDLQGCQFNPWPLDYELNQL